MLKTQFTPLPKKLWLSSPTMHGAELSFIKEAYETNWMSTVGENINAVEALSAQATGAACAVALSSGTAALHLAMKLAGIGPGDKVLCSAMTFAATVNPVLYEGAEPVFVDADYETWNMDPKALERAFERYPEAKAVVVAHLYGTPAKIKEIAEITHRHGAVLIEDAAESLGAAYDGQMTGAFGDFGVISFNGNKIITGSAGGCLLLHDTESAQLARKWSTQSRDDAPWYQHSQVGYNYRMSNVVAGVVRGQFPYLQEHIAQKKAIYEAYQAAFADLPLQMNPVPAPGSGSSSNYWLSCILLDEAAMCAQQRDDALASFVPADAKSCPTEILETLSQYNAEGRPIWKPLHLQPLFADCAFVAAREGADVSADIFRRGLCLPSDNKMSRAAQEQVIAMVRACFA